MRKVIYILFIAAFTFLLLYTRFININWGLPYPFHPDERNMADAIVQLKCTAFAADKCLNPHFFAYGQFPLYLAYFFIQFIHLLSHKQTIDFNEAVLALRFISAVASVFTALILIKTVRLLLPKKAILSSAEVLFFSLLIVFCPAFIQLAHFGTTESLLIFFYSWLVYLSVCLLQFEISLKRFYVYCSLILGLAIATKVSALLFFLIPLLVINYCLFTRRQENRLGLMFFASMQFVISSCVLSVFFSPHNFISFGDFMSSMQYESSVGTGAARVFYTTQFEKTIPIIFQLNHIFPYALGYGIFFLFLVSFFVLPWRKEINLIRLAILFYFLPQAFLYAKWMRFIAPIFPFAVILVTVLLLEIYIWFKENIVRLPSLAAQKMFETSTSTLFLILILFLSIPGIAYLSIYTSRDVRYVASDWISDNITTDKSIFSETANVVDLPIQSPDAPNKYRSLHPISFNLYEVDNDPSLAEQMRQYIPNSDYIFIPSRRVFANYTCEWPEQINSDVLSVMEKKNKCAFLSSRYPILTNYYHQLFNGTAGYKQIAEFNSYPQISIGDWKLLELRDEQAEETWTVFDHPVIRVYQKQ